MQDRVKQNESIRTFEWKWKWSRLSDDEEIERVCYELIIQAAHLSIEEDKWNRELEKRQVILSNFNYESCIAIEETCQHIFLHCPWANETWAMLETWSVIDVSNPSSIEQLIYATNQLFQSNKQKKVANAIILVSLWSIWKAQNERIFKGVKTPPWRLIEEIKSQAYLWIKNRGNEVILNWDTWLNFPFMVH